MYGELLQLCSRTYNAGNPISVLLLVFNYGFVINTIEKIKKAFFLPKYITYSSLIIRTYEEQMIKADVVNVEK